ncbi:MAG: hydroxyacid dehydrogenase [Candidatus Bathyarchaeia archaeon]
MFTRRQIFIGCPINVPQIYEPLKEQGYELIFGAEPCHPIASARARYSEEELIEKLRDVDAVLSSSPLPLTRRVLTATRRLLCICQRIIGYDNIDVETASELGILVSNAPSELNFISVAEHTVALILSLAKKLKIIPNLLIRDSSVYYDECINTMILKGKTVGIIGLGRIGARVATLLRAFDVELFGYDPYVTMEKARNIGVRLVDLDKLLKESDLVTIHSKLTAETYHMIGPRELALMKKTAYIINTARGAIIDEAALINALKKGVIAGAALDVLEKEPITPNNPLLKMDNVILTPHIAGRNTEAIIEGEKLAVSNILNLMKGNVTEYVVNPEAIPEWKKRFTGFQ